MPGKWPHPLVTIGDALLVIVFCAVSLAATTGVIPDANSKSEAASAAPVDRPTGLSDKPAQPGAQTLREHAQPVAARACTACGVVSSINVVEKQASNGLRWDVTVRMNDGSSRSYSFDAEPAFRTGDRIRIVDSRQLV